jgi:hypothetical protein
VPERTDWAKISASWTERIDERIAELERLRAGLTRCIGCGCLSLQDCQLANPGDRASDSVPVLAIGLVTKDFKVSASIEVTLGLSATLP